MAPGPEVPAFIQLKAISHASSLRPCISKEGRRARSLQQALPRGRAEPPEAVADAAEEVRELPAAQHESARFPGVGGGVRLVRVSSVRMHPQASLIKRVDARHMRSKEPEPEALAD